MSSKRVYIETFGCQMNVADTERAVNRLRASGYDISDSPESADVLLFNTCSVRARAEQKVYNRIGEELKQAGKSEKIIGVMGCVAQLEGESIFDRAPKVNFVVGTRAVDRLPEMIGRVLDGEKRASDLGERRVDEGLDISPVERHSPYVAFVPIIEGCNKFCTYCIVPYSRGRERSRSAVAIVSEVNRLHADGYQEVHLIGQNVNSYRPLNDVGLEKFTGATPFSRLLRAVAATGIARIKFTTSFPRDFHPDIMTAIEERQNLCDWIHLPVQSGSDRILRRMRRGYNADYYRRLVNVIKQAKRTVAFTSDIIVGFPGETDEDFEQTLKLIEYCQYDAIYIFKYSERNGTPAAKLTDDVPSDVKTARFQALSSMQKTIQGGIQKSLIGRTLDVLVEGESAKSALDMTGHSTCHRVVNFRGGHTLAGRVVEVRVTDAKVNSLYGELMN